PTGLRAIRAGGSGPSTGNGDGSASASSRYTLRWEWAPGAEYTTIAARHGSPPEGPEDPTAMVLLVPRDEYERQQGWSLTLPNRGPAADSTIAATNGHVPRGEHLPWCVRLFSATERGGVRADSPGLEKTAAITLSGPIPEVIVSYSLRRPWLPGAPWSLTFRTEPAGATTPPLVVVAHPRAVPLSVDDGEIIAHLPPVRDGTRVPLIGRFKLGRHGVRVFPDPSVPPDQLTPIRFRHPETGATRV
ncbi:MAG: hypothetical protein ACYC61_20315, partial [Isosphaeraceae bacterium]